MVSVLISFSRITLMAFVLIFTFVDVIQIFEFKISEVLGSVLSTIQSVMVVLFIINTSVILYLVKEDYIYLFLLAGQLLLFAIIGLSMNRLTYPMSRALINNMLFFLSLSFVFLERLSQGRAVRQFVFAIVSLIVSLIVIYVLRQIKKIREFVKLSYLFFISGCIVIYKDFRGFLFASIGSAIHVLILVFSKDLGTALIFLVTYVFLIFIAYKNYIVLGLEIGIATIGGLLAYNLFPHIQSRFVAWSDPLSVVDDKGYQISQSLFAIGTGSWVGSGFTAGNQLLQRILFLQLWLKSWEPLLQYAL